MEDGESHDGRCRYPLSSVLSPRFPPTRAYDRPSMTDVYRQMIDTLARCWPVLGVDNENDNARVAAALGPFLELCRQAEVTIVVLHHTGKITEGHGREIRGAGGSESPICLMIRAGPSMGLQLRSREYSPAMWLTLWLSKGISPHSGMKRTSTVWWRNA